MSAGAVEPHDAHVREWERATGGTLPMRTMPFDPEGNAEPEAVQSEAVSPGETTDEMLNRVFAKGPIHGPGYDQDAALRRKGRKNGEPAPANATAGDADGREALGE